MVVLGSVRFITLQSARARVPSIKFRSHGAQPVVTQQQSSSNPQATVSQQPSGPQYVIEDYQLPLKYQRRPIDEKEIEYINRGGPE